MTKRNTRKGLLGAIFGWIFGILMILGGVSAPVYAEPVGGDGNVTQGIDAGAEASQGENGNATEDGEDGEKTDEKDGERSITTGGECADALGSLGWLVCPATGKIAEAVDWLYEKIENILVINPVEMKDGTPIYEIWKYFRGITNIVFIIFLIIMVYSQITGMGISNYGLKKALPKLIIAAVLVNLSFILCSVFVDVSNAIGGSLRGLFSTIQENAFSSVTLDQTAQLSMAQMYNALAGGGFLAVGAGAIAFESGAIWMLIPVVLGAVVAVVAGLITIALRQAVVALLIMIAPLAIVAYVLPNTDGWFKKWRQLLTKMLVFYPMFSLLFGASQLAGFAIIASAHDGFGILVGVAVQIFPLFFSWSLMKMSGTLLSTVNAKIRTWGSRPVAGVRTWAESHRQATRARNLAKENVYTPSLYLRQYLNDRKVAREERTAKDMEVVKMRGQAYRAGRNYRRDGTPSQEAEYQVDLIRQKMVYEGEVLRDKTNLDEGLGATNKAAMMRRGNGAPLAVDSRRQARLDRVDRGAMDASDMLDVEKGRAEMVARRNAEGRYGRFEAAINARIDDTRGYEIDENGNRVRKSNYKFHFDEGSAAYKTAIERYGNMLDVMNNNEYDAHYAGARAAQDYDTQMKIITTKFQKYFELNPPTQSDIFRLQEFSQGKRAIENIDSIIAGLRVINQRGDTDLVRSIWMDIKKGGIELGSHASQAMASFLMFDVGNNDPLLRREGKYINLETAKIYNENERKEMYLDPYEYIRGYYVKRDENGNVLPDIPENRVYSKKPMTTLLQGTSFDNIERTAMGNLTDAMMEAYGYQGVDANGNVIPWDVEGWLKKNKEARAAIGPQFISASLKYLSGSEQLGSAVTFLTGYSEKKLKEKYIDANGVERERELKNADGSPVYGLVPVWEDKKFAGHENEVKDFYQGQVGKWLKDQTVSQIFNMRSDYRDSLAEHLAEMYLDENPDELFDGQDLFGDGEGTPREKYERARAEIQTRYGDLSADEARKKREADLKALKMEMFNRELRKLLGSNGVLDRVAKMSRTSASGSTKNWMSESLLYNNEAELRAESEFYKNKRIAAHKIKREEGSSDTPANEKPRRIYNEADVTKNVAELDDFWRNYDHDTDINMLYEDLLEFIVERFGEGSVMESEFRLGVEKYLDQMSNDELMEFLKEYLKDLDRYE